jgi:septal ring factor EnvC (AmiA/AmiB activator)
VNPRRGRWRYLPCTLPLLALLVAVAATADREADLERLREAIELSRERVTSFELEHRSLLETLEALDLASIALVKEVAVARASARSARAELAKVEAEAVELAERLRATEDAMSRRAVALYKSGDAAGVRMLFAAGGIREFLARSSLLRRLLQRDLALLDRHRLESQALDAARLRAAGAAEASTAAAEALQRRERELVGERAAKQRLVAQVHQDRGRERAALVELEKAARALEETLRNLQDHPETPLGAIAGPPFETLKSKLEPPVDAALTGRFGRVVDEEFFTETYRTGVVFGADYGTPVRAVAAGRVRYAGWFRGFGRLVIVAHGGSYFTVSGHLSEMVVAVGDRVAAGDTLGAVGDTGSLIGPQLYFEIRLGGDPLDPAEWLRGVDSR